MNGAERQGSRGIKQPAAHRGGSGFRVAGRQQRLRHRDPPDAESDKLADVLGRNAANRKQRAASRSDRRSEIAVSEHAMVELGRRREAGADAEMGCAPGMPCGELRTGVGRESDPCSRPELRARQLDGKIVLAEVDAGHQVAKLGGRIDIVVHQHRYPAGRELCREASPGGDALRGRRSLHSQLHKVDTAVQKRFEVSGQPTSADRRIEKQLEVARRDVRIKNYTHTAIPPRFDRQFDASTSQRPGAEDSLTNEGAPGRSGDRGTEFANPPPRTFERNTTRPLTERSGSIAMALQGHDKLRLLVADDDANLREALGEFFSREGFAVELAASGLEAIALLQQRLFDVSVLDGHMPGLTGPQVLRRLLADFGPAAIPPTLLVSSDIAIEAWVREQFGVGKSMASAVGFVSKPIRLDALRRSIQQLLGRPPAHPFH
ncbi:MAG: response regulator [Planctomycetes bacterium]|nr:response regulator [Planctomycetota bacterium]